MNILFGIQATGNGHIARSTEIYKVLAANPSIKKIDIILSGNNGNLDVPFIAKYLYKGISFSYGKGGKVSILKTIAKANVFSFIHGISSIPFKEYDLIISDFEPISLWGAKIYGVPSVGISNTTEIKKTFSGKITGFISKIMCPSKEQISMYYQKLNEKTFHPIIREEIRNATVDVKPFILIYLLSYSDKELELFFSNSTFSNYHFIIYSKEYKSAFSRRNITFKPINKDSFTMDLISCDSIISTAGFQTTSEALYLNKKLLVIPISNQWEQKYNASVLEKLGIEIQTKLGLKEVANWLKHPRAISIQFDNDLPKMIQHILNIAA